MADIFKYFPPEDSELNSMTSSFQKWEIDAGHVVPTKEKKIVYIYLFYNYFPIRIMFTFLTRIRFTISTRSRFTLL